MSRYSNLTPLVQDSNGKPITGAKTYFYEPGTETLKDVYSDSGLTTPQANPVISLAGGYLPEIYLDGLYKVVQNDENDVSLWPSLDPVGASISGNFAAYDADISYSTPECVYATDDNYYYSLTDSNQGNEPSVSPGQWQIIPMNEVVGLTATQTLTNKEIDSAAYTGTQTGFIGNVTGDLTGNADTVTTNANLTGDVTSVGNVTTLAIGVIDSDNIAADAVRFSSEISDPNTAVVFTVTSTPVVMDAGVWSLYAPGGSVAVNIEMYDDFSSAWQGIHGFNSGVDIESGYQIVADGTNIRLYSVTAATFTVYGQKIYE